MCIPVCVWLNCTLIAGYIEEPAGFIANPKVFRLPFIGQWLDRMDVISDGDSEKVYEDVTKQLEKGQSLILSLDGSIDPIELAAAIIFRW